MPPETANVLLTGVKMHIFGPRWATGKPIWEAEITVTAHGPVFFRDARTVFVPANGPEPRLPGTIVVHAVVNHVHLSYGNNESAVFGVRPGQTAARSTFVLQIDPVSWQSAGGDNVVCHKAICIAGQFPLLPYMTNVPAPLNMPMRTVFPDGTPVTDLEAASSGLLLTGTPKMPDGTAFTKPLPFLIEVAQPQGDGDLIIRLDPERLYSNTDTSELARYFATLQSRLNPQNGNTALLNWQRLVLTDPTRLPEFWWYLSPGDTTTIRFAEGEWRLLFADQDLTAKDNPTRGVLDGAPKVTITNTEVKAVLGTGSTSTSKGVYTANRLSDSAYDEKWSFADLHFGYDAVDTASRLRRTLGIPTPRIDDRDELSNSDALTGSLAVSDGLVDPPWLWAGMPQHNGWAQIPVFNITEQILVQALPEPWQENAPPTSNQVLRGGVIYGNDRTELYAPAVGDLPWNFTLLSADHVEGTWKFDGQKKLAEVKLTLNNPQVTAEGMFWLATTPPSSNDSLPTLDNWVNGIETIPLRTHGIRSVYPSPFEWYVPELSFVRTTEQNNFVCAKLQTSTWTYRISSVAHTGRITTEELPPQFFALPAGDLQLTAPIYVWLTALAKTPFLAKLEVGVEWQTKGKPRINGLSWQHHPTQPSVQTLPLTQNNVPANYPSASRQLLPFDLPLTFAPLADPEFKCIVQRHTSTGSLEPEIIVKVPTYNLEGWTWEWDVATRGWQVQDAAPSAECKDVLALAMLGLPGVALAELGADGIADPKKFLKRLRYRHDLPLLDQVYALADLPPEGPTAEQVTPSPLLREGYQTHWRKLTEKGILAAVDEAEALVTESGKLVIRGLAEPRLWPVKVKCDLAQYPASIAFADAETEANMIVLKAETHDALRGLDGGFVEQGANLRLVAPGSAATVSVVGGSTAMMKRGNQLRDQRGLARGATSEANPHLLITPLTQPQGNLSLLTLTQQSLALTVGPTTWQLWFKDLPAKGAGPFTFLRADASSPARRGVNDPKATGRDLGPWNGYEWRMGPFIAPDKPWFPLGKLRFYPLALEEVRLRGATPIVAEKIVILGRLELPAWDGQTGVAQRERPFLDSAVQVSFINGVLTDVRRAEPDWEETPKPFGPAMWPLADRAPETEAPVLLWTDRTGGTSENLLQTHETLGPSIIVRSGRLSLELSRYGLLWHAPAEKDLVFPLDGTTPPIVDFQVPVLSQQQSGIEKLSLSLNLTTGLHRLTAEWLFRLGAPTELWLEARYIDELLAPGPMPTRVTANLRNGTASPVSLDVQTGNLRLDSGGLELVWLGFERPPTDLQVLPGISLDQKKDACWGTALLAFTLKEQPTSVPKVVPSGGLLSVLLRCVWGKMLQDATAQEFVAADFTQATFNSCAGNVLAEYTTTLQTAEWQTELALSGLVEVKNLVSWPTSFAVQTGNKLAFDKPAGTLDHVRHTIRILLAEHRIPQDILRGSLQPNCILTLEDNACWNFRAVVEHQLVPITLTNEASVAALPASEIRWTVSQDVRWTTPRGLYNHLATTRSSGTVRAPETDLASDRWRVLERRNTFDGLEQSRFWAALNLTSSGSFPVFENTALAKFADALLVDATVPIFLRQRPLTSAGGTQLFPLADTVVLSGSTSLADFTYSQAAPGDMWQLLSVPFFGRLQGSTPSHPQAPMVEDPVVAVHRTRSTMITPLVCAFTHYSNMPLTLQTTLFDQHALRQFRRLDASSVAEGWMRLKRAQAKRPTVNKSLGSAFQIVSADTPARLANSDTLDSLFDPNRTSLPPQRDSTPTLQNVENAFVWTPQAIHAVQVAVSPITFPEQFPFLTFPLMLHQSGLFGNGLVRRPAATLLPTHTTTAFQPTSLALVPFAQLSLQALPGEKELFLATCELLVFDAQRQSIGVAATHVVHQSAEARDIADVEPQLLAWSTATHARLAADSPCAILRVRLLFRHGDRVSVQVYYLTSPVNVAPVLAPQRASAIQAPPERLRQRQGQLNQATLPNLGQLESFELAPPMIRGAQPIRLVTRPEANLTWPWGWSGVRMSSVYRGEQRGAAGSLIPEDRYAVEHSLWWQASEAQVQFAIPPDRDLLPQYFRASSIPGYLPAAPSIPWPDATLLKELIAKHQPVLPGSRYTIVTGLRPGAPYALRETVATQWLHDGTSQVSGQAVLQMRAPRPILLPSNIATAREWALQTWGSWFDVTGTVRVSSHPEAEFFTLDNGQTKAMRVSARRPTKDDYPDMDNAVVQKQMELAAKTSHACELPATWDGWLFFDFTELAGSLADWPERVVLSSGDATFAYQRDTTIRPLKKTNHAWYMPTNMKLVSDWFAAQTHGQEATIVVSSKVPSSSVQDSLQTARLPLRVTKAAFPLPFSNRVLTFEDPEYNRDLSSTPVRTETIITLANGQVLTVVLAADRAAYNTTGAIHFLHFFGNNENPGNVTADVSFTRLAPDGTASLIKEGLPLMPNSLPGALDGLDPRDLASIGQHKAGVPLRVDDELLLTVTLKEAGVVEPKAKLALRLPIVARPTTPTPEAGYALLRRTQRGSKTTDECRRFAWGPDATRIELSDPADLKRQLVRRRAVFVWYDTIRINDAKSARPGQASQHTTHYAIQKSTMRGSTHFPTFIANSENAPGNDDDL
jgi:hypothetical protein